MRYLVLVLLLSGCATTTPQGRGVMVHSQMSTLLNDCEKMGGMEATATKAIPYYVQSAQNELRNRAAEMGADTIVILNTEQTIASVTVQAMALKCG